MLYDPAQNGAKNSALNSAPLVSNGLTGAWQLNNGNAVDRSAIIQSSVNFTVEKVDNGYILRSGHQGMLAKIKVCKDVDELRDLFVASLVEYQLEK